MYELTRKQKDVLDYYFDKYWWGDPNSKEQYDNFIKYHRQWIINDSFKQKVAPDEIELEIYVDGKFTGLRHKTSVNFTITN